MTDPNLSSKDRLANLLADCEASDFNVQDVQQMQQTVKEQMEVFDMTSRQQTADVFEELSKIVITT